MDHSPGLNINHIELRLFVISKMVVNHDVRVYDDNSLAELKIR